MLNLAVLMLTAGLDGLEDISYKTEKFTMLIHKL
jgi:hypothetical protein